MRLPSVVPIAGFHDSMVHENHPVLRKIPHPLGQIFRARLLRKQFRLQHNTTRSRTGLDDIDIHIRCFWRNAFREGHSQRWSNRGLKVVVSNVRIVCICIAHEGGVHRSSETFYWIPRAAG